MKIKCLLGCILCLPNPWELTLLPFPSPSRQYHSQYIQASKLKHSLKGGGRKESKSGVSSRSWALVEGEERGRVGDRQPPSSAQSPSREHTHWPQQKGTVHGHRWVPAPLAGCSLSAEPEWRLSLLFAVFVGQLPWQTFAGGLARFWHLNIWGCDKNQNITTIWFCAASKKKNYLQFQMLI